MIKCHCCKISTEGIYGTSYDLPILDSSTGEIKKDNTDKIILILCDKCGAILGVYK
ncbi:hypothetical protein KKC83_05355 [Patescibacteria group bacterium]|nr:hypothetical protein [Patescibacteria group bacterium]MBU4026944.1 hypothetical protein [Patescibacteria group bacterium]